MNTSVAWINDYLEPPASAQEQAEALTRAGFPMESREEMKLGDGEIDIRQDIELTSNRGDCLCHVGLAREIAAVTGRPSLKLPQPRNKATGPAASTIAKVTNKEKSLCPLYAARLIRGVKVGPSPKWLRDRLLARGDIPRNNIVDASNFVLFELGQPTHVFDLAKLKGPEIIVRRAKADEAFLPIGEGAAQVKLGADDLVIADAQDAVAIAGVKGGALTAVTNSTRDILIEIATFDPASVRNTGRRLGISSDSQYRFERGVHPGQIEFAAERLVQLILEVCGGELCEGTLIDGTAISPKRKVTLRCERCRKILGMDISDQQMVDSLARLGFEAKLKQGAIDCTIPYQRIEIEREVDLIEEVGRMIGHDAIPIADAIAVRVAPPQPHELARRAVNDALVGMGYIETVTHSLVPEAAAKPFCAPDVELLRLADARGKAESVLRPSILPSLLRVLAFNRDHGVKDVKLFETAATFGLWQAKHIEIVNLAMVHPAESLDHGLRSVRGAIDRLVQIVLGPDAVVEVRPEARLPWFNPGAAAFINGKMLGMFGLLSQEALKQFDLKEPVFAAEIGLPAYYDRYPPPIEARELPHFPPIERDVSAIVDEPLKWIEVKQAMDSLRLQHAEAVEFVTTFRGKQIGAGKKSLTLRVRFRALDRTLKHDEVSPQMDAVMNELKSRFGAEIRA